MPFVNVLNACARRVHTTLVAALMRPLGPEVITAGLSPTKLGVRKLLEGGHSIAYLLGGQELGRR